MSATDNVGKMLGENLGGAFYPNFERHAHGAGLKGHSTHYCPGCGHGLAHKFLAEAIDELGIQNRTVAVSPVGCAVFLYYYLDVGNTQAAHGRAPAVALGHKLANPESVVVSYQGDGDLASIGLAEILQVAQMGLPMTFLFVNNAIYGMTGGQMAPTTLMQQTTTTSPAGRDRFCGEPLKMAELVAKLDGPIYVERVALYDAKRRTRAKKAIKKALQLQVENRGLAFVEILAECPTHLKATPQEAERWVREEMEPVFPLGVLKDQISEPWPAWSVPNFDPAALCQVLGATEEAAPRFGATFPTHLDPDDVALKFAGAGGDGAQTAARLTALGAIQEAFDATTIPSYGPESRGGTSYADVHVARQEVLSPAAPEPHVLVAFNAPSLEKFAPRVREGGMVIYDATVIEDSMLDDLEIASGVEALGIPFTRIATELGRPLVKNVVALGALAAATRLLPPETFLQAMRQKVDGCALQALNEEAFRQGMAAANPPPLRSPSPQTGAAAPETGPP